MTLPMWLLAILSAIAGFPKDKFMEFITGYEIVHHKGVSYILPLSVLLALSGIVLAWLIYEREWVKKEKITRPFMGIYNVLRRKYFLDDFYEVLYRNGLLIISHTFGFFDRYVVDGTVNFVSWLVSRTGIALRTLQSGRIQDYLYGILLGVLFLMLLGYFR